jgi:hypothetical protein
MCRQVGLYAAGLLKGAKPMDLPVMQGHQVRAVINLNTARALQPRCAASWIRLDKVVGRDFPVVRGINRRRGDIIPRADARSRLTGVKAFPSFLAYPVPSDCESSEGTGSEELGRPSSGAPAHLSRKLWQQRKLASRSLAPALAGSQ